MTGRLPPVMALLVVEMEESPRRGGWSTPPGCVGGACRYRAEWSLDAESDVITFTVIAKQSEDFWTGIAFARERQMVG